MPPGTTAAYDGPQQIVDLTTRWRHLERRVVGQPLLAAWQFDEGSGYAFDDVSGRGHTLHVTGTRWNTTDSGLLGALHRRGARGGAIYLDGTRWLEAARSRGFTAPAGLTITCWLRVDELPPTGTTTLVATTGGLALTVDVARRLVLSVATASGETRVARSAAAAVILSRWTQATVTISPAGGRLRLYVDGLLTGQAVGQPFTLGAAPTSLLLGSALTGALDETAIYEGVLGPEAVHRQYVVGLPKVFTQSSESVDAERAQFSRFKGSDPVPHPRTGKTVASFRFAATATTEEGLRPGVEPAATAFVPGVFGGAWRAADQELSYPSPLKGSSGSFEAWHRMLADPADPARLRRRELFTAAGPAARLTLYTIGARWCVDVRRPGGATSTITGRRQAWTAQALEHVAVTWGEQPGGERAVVLYVNGAPVGALAVGAAETTYPTRIGLGGTPAAPAWCLLDDVRICDTALAAGDVCPRGHATTDAAGLDLRDSFDRPPGATPMLWRSGSPSARWSHRRKTWERPTTVGDDPDRVRALFQGSPDGMHPLYHPDAFGYASSIEVGVAFPAPTDGWAGCFVQAAQPSVGASQDQLSGVTFMINPARSELRLARMTEGRLTSTKLLRHDFTMTPRTTYELTLVSAGDGIVRGFVDGSNVISMRLPAGSPASGYAGLLTDGAAAFFSALHFTALTPATADSRVIRLRPLRYGAGAAIAELRLTPFRWHKRPGLLPWQYRAKVPEPPGNIAGADTPLPERPISPARWRSEDSANSDLVVVNGRMLYFMRGNPRVDGQAAPARIGVLHVDVAAFDGLHFVDPNLAAGTLTGGTILVGGSVGGSVGDDRSPGRPVGLQLNAPSSAYVGDGRLLFLGRESGLAESGGADDGRLVYSHFDTGTGSWVDDPAKPASWSAPPGSAPGEAPPVPDLAALHGSPEVVSLREPDGDRYQAVLLQQTGHDGRAEMATALLTHAESGAPVAIAGMPVRRSLSRTSGGAIYGFRVMFDNGIYYLHYNDGVQVPDWPDRFVLAATLDPFAGPWVENPGTTGPGSTYFRRGSEFEPDNGAIWQGTMVKHRGRYYLYYENYHAIGDVDLQYGSYADPQAGSRVGFATA